MFFDTRWSACLWLGWNSIFVVLLCSFSLPIVPFMLVDCGDVSGGVGVVSNRPQAPQLATKLKKFPSPLDKQPVQTLYSEPAKEGWERV